MKMEPDWELRAGEAQVERGSQREAKESKTETARGRVAGRKGEEFSICAENIETKHLNSVYFF